MTLERPRPRIVVSVLVDTTDPEALVGLRHRVQGELEGQVDPTQLQDLAVVVSELATNAMRHGALPVRVSVGVTPTDAVVEVSDHGEEMPRLLDVDHSSPGGLGLVIVDRLARGWEVLSEPVGKTVRAVVPLA